LIIGAAKACIGHTEVAAGLVGIVKAIKQLSEGKVAGLNSLNNGRLNPEIDTSSVPLHIPSKLTDFPQRDGPPSPRRALVVYAFTSIFPPWTHLFVQGLRLCGDNFGVHSRNSHG
jgi:acyl transferase domain-containing protein